MNKLRLKPTLLASCLMAFLPLSALADKTLHAVDNQHNRHIESTQLLNKTVINDADRLVAYTQKGIALESVDGKTMSLLKGNFGSVDHRQVKQGLLLASVDLDRQQAIVALFNNTSQDWAASTYLPQPDFKIESVCLYQDEAQNGFLFLVGEQGQGEQWLVADASSPIALPQLIRHISTPPESEYCQVDDALSRFYINEESVGIWAYDAHPEADLSRYPVALVEPFGQLKDSAAGMAIVPGGLLVLDAESSSLSVYVEHQEQWQLETSFPLKQLIEPEAISARMDGEKLDIIIKHDMGTASYTLPWPHKKTSSPEAIPLVTPLKQTDPVPSLGDAADDPAIWVNQRAPEQSLILGTDKQGGLSVYDLDGKTQSFLAVGRLNNVDVRHGFHFNGKQVDLAVASNRDNNSLHVFAIDPGSRKVSEIGEVATHAQDIYGLCMYKNKQGDIYTIVNDKDGRFFQYLMQDKHGNIAGELVREFKVATQPEGCVADDKHDRLFIGEENRAVWTLDARADEPTVMTQVMPVGEHLKEDIEGISLYQTQQQNFLVISSQGNNSYVILDALPPFAYRGVFRIGFNTAVGIDGVSETDGLDVTSINLGQSWQQGMLVVQDGRNRMPRANQNFKYVPWSAIADQLGLTDINK